MWGGTNAYAPELGNKSAIRNDSYKTVSTIKGTSKIFHFSIDDTINVFKDIMKNNYKSIFDNNTLLWLRDLHENYGTCVTMFVFYGDDEFNLSEFPDNYKQEFEDNSNWLRFGFHSIDANTIYDDDSTRDLSYDYELVTKELVRIAGMNSIDNVVRLASFKGKQNEIAQISDCTNSQPIVGLLTADDKRNSYDLDNNNNDYIYCHDYITLGSITYISTDLRVEFIDNVNKKLDEISNCSAWNNQRNIMEVFTHEWELNYVNKEKIEDICNWMNKQGYINGFMEDKIG